MNLTRSYIIMILLTKNTLTYLNFRGGRSVITVYLHKITIKTNLIKNELLVIIYHY